jgi:hypothetical protein
MQTDLARPGAYVVMAAAMLAGSYVMARPAMTTPGAGEPALAEVRAHTERFRDVRVALAEGYVHDPMEVCETASTLGGPAAAGAIGVRLFRRDLLGIAGPPAPRVDGVGTHVDFRTPGMLIYEPQADGSLELVAVGSLVFAAAWREAGHHEPPTFHGVPYDARVDDPATVLDEAHLFSAHFARHVWLFRDNPDGVFAPFNQEVSCEHHEGSAGPGSVEASS